MLRIPLQFMEAVAPSPIPKEIRLWLCRLNLRIPIAFKLSHKGFVWVCLIGKHHFAQGYGISAQQNHPIVILFKRNGISAAIHVPEHEFRHHITIVGELAAYGFEQIGRCCWSISAAGDTVKLHVGHNEYGFREVFLFHAMRYRCV